MAIDEIIITKYIWTYNALLWAIVATKAQLRRQQVVVVLLRQLINRGSHLVSTAAAVEMYVSAVAFQCAQARAKSQNTEGDNLKAYIYI